MWIIPKFNLPIALDGASGEYGFGEDENKRFEVLPWTGFSVFETVKDLSGVEQLFGSVTTFWVSAITLTVWGTVGKSFATDASWNNCGVENVSLCSGDDTGEIDRGEYDGVFTLEIWSGVDGFCDLAAAKIKNTLIILTHYEQKLLQE